MFESERRLIDAVREPRPEDVAESSGKYFALATLLADALEKYIESEEELRRRGNIDEPC